MHALCNAVVAVLVWNDLVETLVRPETCAGPTSRDASVFAVGVHAYHALLFPLSWDDRVHHAVFAGLMGGLTTTYPSRASNACLFFLSGLPGALLYTFLVARRCGRLRHLNEPAVSAAIHAGPRLLGILVCSGAFLVSPAPSRPPFHLAQFLLCAGNGVYYAHQSVRRALRGRRSRASSP